MGESIVVEIADGVGHITLNRPERLNAFDSNMADGWQEATERVVYDAAVGAILVDAVGRAFCAGGDLAHMAAAQQGAGVTRLAGAIGAGIRTLVSSDKPVMAVVQGAVAGGGLGVMLSADHIIASESARFVSRYADVGLTPDLGVSWLLPRAVGERRALALLLSDLALDAPTARDWGLVSEVVAPDALSERAHELMELWSRTPKAFGQAKRLVRAAWVETLADSMSDEGSTIGAAFDGEPARGLIAGFVGRRRA